MCMHQNVNINFRYHFYFTVHDAVFMVMHYLFLVGTCLITGVCVILVLHWTTFNHIRAHFTVVTLQRTTFVIQTALAPLMQ